MYILRLVRFGKAPKTYFTGDATSAVTECTENIEKAKIFESEDAAYKAANTTYFPFMWEPITHEPPPPPSAQTSLFGSRPKADNKNKFLKNW